TGSRVSDCRISARPSTRCGSVIRISDRDFQHKGPEEQRVEDVTKNKLFAPLYLWTFVLPPGFKPVFAPPLRFRGMSVPRARVMTRGDKPDAGSSRSSFP